MYCCMYQLLHCSHPVSARLAMANGISPVIIDNTNTAAWQMKPYVIMVSETAGQYEHHYNITIAHMYTHVQSNSHKPIDRSGPCITGMGEKSFLPQDFSLSLYLSHCKPAS